MSSVIIGVDPGFSGAIAFLRADGGVRTYDMPIVQRRGKDDIDWSALTFLIEDNRGPGSVEAVIEEVAAMPKQGSVSMFRFGTTFGGVRGVLAAMHIPVTLVKPTEWKKALRLSSDKAESVARASELLPKGVPLWTVRRGFCTKPQAIGRAEAALLALWGRRQAEAGMREMLA